MFRNLTFVSLTAAQNIISEFTSPTKYVKIIEQKKLPAVLKHALQTTTKTDRSKLFSLKAAHSLDLKHLIYEQFA